MWALASAGALCLQYRSPPWKLSYLWEPNSIGARCLCKSLGDHCFPPVGRSPILESPAPPCGAFFMQANISTLSDLTGAPSFGGGYNFCWRTEVFGSAPSPFLTQKITFGIDTHDGERRVVCD